MKFIVKANRKTVIEGVDMTVERSYEAADSAEALEKWNQTVKTLRAEMTAAWGFRPDLLASLEFTVVSVEAVH